MLYFLFKKRKTSEIQQEISIFRGKKGLKNIFDDMIKEKNEIFLFGSGGKFKEIFGEIYSEQWLLRIKQNKITIKAIFSEKSRNLLEKMDFLKMKFISETYALPSSTTIYGNKLAIIIYSEQPIAIVIKSKEVSEFYLHYFNALWKIAKK